TAAQGRRGRSGRRRDSRPARRGVAGVLITQPAADREVIAPAREVGGQREGIGNGRAGLPRDAELAGIGRVRVGNRLGNTWEHVAERQVLRPADCDRRLNLGRGQNAPIDLTLGRDNAGEHERERSKRELGSLVHVLSLSVVWYGT